MNILHISDRDVGGGAAKVAWELFRSQQKNGDRVFLAVGRKKSGDSHVYEIPRTRNIWSRSFLKIYEVTEIWEKQLPGWWRARRFLRYGVDPARSLEDLMGWENFHAPGSYEILRALPWTPDVIHCHNLHGRYFDLRALRAFAKKIPVILTLHDPWLLSGHCVHSFDCDRWKTGCGQCPDLNIYPRIRRDATRFNWNRKKRIYSDVRPYVVADCDWVRKRAEASMLGTTSRQIKTIHLGVDRSVFKPVPVEDAREGLGLPKDALIFLFTASTITFNPWKDFQTMQAALKLFAAQKFNQRLLFLALGQETDPIHGENYEIRFFPYESQPEKVSLFYAAADLYLHAARAETFPLAPIEAMACGTPVIGSATGGIPESIKGLKCLEEKWNAANRFGREEATGVLVPQGSPGAMAQAMTRLAHDKELRSQLGDNAVRHVKKHFDWERVVKEYRDYYRAVRKDYKNNLQTHVRRAPQVL